mgnify:FL=1
MIKFTRKGAYTLLRKLVNFKTPIHNVVVRLISFTGRLASQTMG